MNKDNLEIEKLLGRKFYHSSTCAASAHTDISSTIYTIEKITGDSARISWEGESFYATGRKKKLNI